VSDDPFLVLGLTRIATLDQVRAARRRLAFEVHPDRGGDDVSMQRVNAAFEAAVAHLTGRRVLPDLTTSSSSSRSADPPPRVRDEPPPVPWGRHGQPVEHDAPSFTVDALPAEAFEALVIVATWIGEVLDDDPPYVLECQLHEPSPCWCRLDLVPDAGGSTVSLIVATAEGSERVSAEVVRDVWVEQLNQLGRPQP
jgi:hypothetical protein